MTMTIDRFGIGACLIWTLLCTSVIQAKEFNDSTLTHVTLPNWFVNAPFIELDTLLQRARAEGKQGLMVLYSTEGCSYCGLFIKKSLGDPAIAELLQKNFASVGLEIFNDAEMVSPQGDDLSVKEYAKQEGVMFSPTILFYDLEGKRLLRITGYQAQERFKTSVQYVAGKHYRTQTMAEFVKAKQAKARTQYGDSLETVMKPDRLFDQPPYELQRSENKQEKPLLVIFESRNCEECGVFHQKVLANKKVRGLLEKFQIVRLDANDRQTQVTKPDGGIISAADWYKAAGFSRQPALLFYAENGREAIKTDNLVLNQRMTNAINYVLERAYLKGWSYQQFARSKAIERNLKKLADSAKP